MGVLPYFNHLDWMVLAVLCCLCHAAIVVAAGAFKRIAFGDQP